VARILVIDDKKLIRNLLRQALEQVGHEVIEAQNGQQGLQYYWLMPTDLVITDLEMPEKDGLAVIRALRRAFPQSKIIAISGGDQALLRTAETLGVQHTFQKPFGIQEFLEAVHELVQIQDERAKIHSL